MIELQDTNALINYLSGIKKAVQANVVIINEVKMNKTDVLSKTVANPYLGAVATKIVNVTLGADYQDAVNEARAMEGKEPDFKAGKGTWGTHVNANIVEHNGEYYLAFIENFKVGESTYEFQGKPIKYDDLKPFIPVKSGGAFGQGVDEAVKYRRLKLSSIAGITIEGVARYIKK